MNAKCLRDRDELRTKKLLFMFDLMSEAKDSDGNPYFVFKGVPSVNKVNEFQQFFDENTPFGLTCEVCTAKFGSHTQNDNGSDRSNVHKPSGSHENSNQTSQMNQPGMLPANISVSNKPNVHTKRIVIPTEDANGLYTLYVSKADTDSSSDDIVSYLMEKANLNPDIFKVFALPSKRKYRKTYNAFKITVFTREVCELLCNSDIWSSEYRVRAFEKTRNRSNVHGRKHNDYRRTTAKSTSNSRHSNRFNNNSNKHHTRHNRNNNNNNNQRRDMNNQHRRRREDRSNEFGYHNRNRNNHNGRYNYEPRHRVDHMHNGQLPQTNMPPPFWYQTPYFYPPPQQQVHSQPTMPLFHPHYTHAPHQNFQPFNVQNHNGM
ncbi:GATA zinc finger domain-containing protein 15-like [Hylaeus volcanicus]|uniref:GATA zinc finger domain-containing protein 15-like n=1 Tax=Hylaeus volcanicus TaxID=313075 RepID=UPI0023B7A8B5|nr:GATA zinc finger domain-containing protein 15-like [Hylaeus volcanicus]